MDWLNFIVSVLTGIVISVPLIIKVVSAVQEAVRNKNWNALINLILENMKEAQKQFETGAERKEFVMGMIEVNAAQVNYPLSDQDYDRISAMIDSLCDMANIVGVRAKKTAKKG